MSTLVVTTGAQKVFQGEEGQRTRQNNQSTNTGQTHARGASHASSTCPLLTVETVDGREGVARDGAGVALRVAATEAQQCKGGAWMHGPHGLAAGIVRVDNLRQRGAGKTGARARLSGGIE